jgi:hypothetical protein
MRLKLAAGIAMSAMRKSHVPMNEQTPSPAPLAVSDDPPPRPPVEPDPGDCCGNGCDPCIFDFYEEARQHYREALAAWRERHPGVDPAAWPPSTPDKTA